MSVYIGASGPNIHIGGDTAIARAAVLDGATSHITIDGLAADAYGQTDVAHGYVMLIKAAVDVNFNWYATIGDNTNGQNNYVGVAASTGAGGAEGRLRSAVSDTPSATSSFIAGSAATGHVDSAWHLVHCADHKNGVNGDVTGQVDGATREVMASYVRYAVPSGGYDWFSIGCRRFQAAPLIQAILPMTVGYFARYDGEILSQAAWTAIWDAFNTGGGRRNTIRITNAIQAQLTGAGVCKWAGPLDESTPHVNTDSVAAPIYVDCTFEDAGY